MNRATIFFVVTLVLGVSCLPSRVRRQFNWGQFENPDLNSWDSNSNRDSNIRIPRQRFPTNWADRQQTGRQLPGNTNFNLDNGFDNQGIDINGGFDNQGIDINGGFENLGSDGIGNGVSSTTSGTTTTKAPANYTNCVNACQFTRQYNPVCGTDSNTYSNIHELNCAASCGRSVQLFRGGTCRPL